MKKIVIREFSKILGGKTEILQTGGAHTPTYVFSFVYEYESHISLSLTYLSLSYLSLSYLSISHTISSVLLLLIFTNCRCFERILGEGYGITEVSNDEKTKIGLKRSMQEELSITSKIDWWSE